MATEGVVTAHPDGDVNKAGLLNTVTWVQAGLAALILTARVITRTKVIQTFGWDDSYMIFAMVCIPELLVCA